MGNYRNLTIIYIESKRKEMIFEQTKRHDGMDKNSFREK